jgi:poly-gamma-glutamate capsule biosynthesis protein CapA/YwtB (metallophosphatase superfamily)
MTPWWRAARIYRLILVLLTIVPWRATFGQEVTLVAGGDIEWSRFVRLPEITNDAVRGEGRGRGNRRADGWMPVPYVITPESKAHLEKTLGISLDDSTAHHVTAIQYGLTFATPREMAQHPFRHVRALFTEADMAFANLETPLSDRARHSGAFMTPTAFAEGLRWAGIDVVSTANNHALDAEGEGLLHTKEALRRVGVGAVGTGRNLEDARAPFILERNGIRVAFLGYSMFVNGGDGGFATPARSGVVPLDPFIIKEDIRRVRSRADYVAVSFHWSIENSQDAHPADRAFARDIIDAGADLVLGHHPHVPRGLELYKGKVIFYSLGNLIFGHSHTYWMDNYVARVTLTGSGISKVEVIPVSGRGKALAQPAVLRGDGARALLEDIKARSAQLETTVEIVGDIGVVTLTGGQRALADPPPGR